MNLSEMNKEQLLGFKKETEALYNDFKSQGLCLNMSRGNPCKEQLELSLDMLSVFDDNDFVSENGVDVRNYGLLDGIPEAKKLFSDMIGVDEDEVIIFGNSSLNAMYWAVQIAYNKGVNGCTPWGKLDKVKFLCPVPGYDRHFKVTEFFGVEMINIPMTATGPDMDMIEKLVADDEDIKGIWCVPQYSNPDGISYSDETVKRFANLRPKAKDFRIFWDNAYCIHHLTDNPTYILNILDEAKKVGNEDIVYIFGSTSKITFPGAGIAVMGASKKNVDDLKKHLGISIISYDKMNQLRHVKFFGTFENMKEHMKKHMEIIAPKFKLVCDMLKAEIAPLGIGEWTEPEGGYFVSFNAMDGCAKRIVKLCSEAGVTLTGAGATFPYGVDKNDRNIRIAPTYPSIEDLAKAMELFIISVKLASAEKLLSDMK
ncbi:MAG: aminotransferase class I/II-fold pyridoxal phosphate-dependent enzyme [Ruminococcus flavefaciens]|nr:aminotransferase class I/II-fold pyridoxal phosphate-dependent enzyme [Ruminococcus flavefaciens]MCM1230537.1 aminotransferase class I/II-fold pyridoxal phosphate-dependent enzyme [Ruminococcus flavefaciens]